MQGIWKYILVGVAAFMIGSATVATATGHIQKLVISNEDETRSVAVTESGRLKMNVRGKLGVTINNPEAMQGPTGPQGAEGSQGVQGIQGLKGDTGNTGPQGADGVDGQDGQEGDQGDTGSQGPAGADAPELVTRVLRDIIAHNLGETASTSCPSPSGSQSGGDFSYCDFSGFSGSANWFSPINFTGSDFSNVTICCNLQTVNFQFANLSNVNFDSANIQSPNFRFANLNGATFVGANLQSPQYLFTICPDGTNSGATGTC